jgi:hypothetical protein
VAEYYQRPFEAAAPSFGVQAALLAYASDDSIEDVDIWPEWRLVAFATTVEALQNLGSAAQSAS